MRYKQFWPIFLLSLVPLTLPATAWLIHSRQEGQRIQDEVGGYDVEAGGEQRALRRLAQILDTEPAANEIWVGYTVNIRRHGQIGFLLANVGYLQKEKSLVHRRLMPFQRAAPRVERITYENLTPNDIDTLVRAKAALCDFQRFKPGVWVKKDWVAPGAW
jgi:hypothetical protein